MLEKKEVTPTEWAANVDRFREEQLADKRNRFFSAYMAKAKQRMKIEVNREALQRAVELGQAKVLRAGLELQPCLLCLRPYSA